MGTFPTIGLGTLGAENRGFMEGKYYPFWKAKVLELCLLLDKADSSQAQHYPFDDIRRYGNRKLWAGHVVIGNGSILEGGDEAHMKNLGKVLAPYTASRPRREYRLSMNKACILTITSFASNEENCSCKSLHEMVWKLPRYTTYHLDFQQLPTNGLYVFFQKDEIGHGGDRIVYIGTHREDDRLTKRLIIHFKEKFRANDIVKKHIGDAILHRANSPKDKIVNWNCEKGDCKQFEECVLSYLQEHFSFVVIPNVEGSKERQKNEKEWIKIVSSCPCCSASDSWLGKYSSNPVISSGKLWNVKHVIAQRKGKKK